MLNTETEFSRVLHIVNEIMAIAKFVRLSGCTPISKQDVFERARPEDRTRTQLTAVKGIVGWLLGHTMARPSDRGSVLSRPEKQ